MRRAGVVSLMHLLKPSFVTISVPLVPPLCQWIGFFCKLIDRGQFAVLGYSIHKPSNCGGGALEQYIPFWTTLSSMLDFLGRETLRTANWFMFSLNEQWKANMHKSKKKMNMAWLKFLKCNSVSFVKSSLAERITAHWKQSMHLKSFCLPQAS
jgi:hypothetical protein